MLHHFSKKPDPTGNTPSEATPATAEKNNFNILRLFAALLVLIGHSSVFLGLPEPLFLSQFSLGALGVAIFFTISGYLISKSWDQDPHLVRFFVRRVLRIFPALVLCLIVTIVVLGPLFTTLPVAAYFKHPATLDYLTSNAALYINFYLPGVFASNRIANAVNGSLWSLPVEFGLYILLAVWGFLRCNRWIYLGIAMVSAFIFLTWAWHGEMLVFYRTDLRQFFISGTYFWMGVVFYKFNLKRHFSTTAVVLAFTVLLSVEANTLWTTVCLWLCLPLIVLAFGFSHSPALNRLTAAGDYSYGVYIYAFPVQQAMAALFPQMPLWPYIIACTLLTLALAVASWHLIEKRALAFKPRRKTGADTRLAAMPTPQAAATTLPQTG